MDWSQVIPIGLQLPLVFIFIWYSDKLFKDARAERELMNAQHREERKEFLAALNKNTEMVEEVLREVRSVKR